MTIYSKLTAILAILYHSIAFSQIKDSAKFPLQITGYFGVVHPIATFQTGIIKMNFERLYNAGFVAGISFLKNKKYGYSFEMVPMLEVSQQSNRIKNIVIQPGIFFPLRKGWTFTSRFSFETTGRYGLTPSLSKIIFSGNHPITMTVPLPFRIGNNQDFSLSTALLVTVGI